MVERICGRNIFSNVMVYFWWTNKMVYVYSLIPNTTFQWERNKVKRFRKNKTKKSSFVETNEIIWVVKKWNQSKSITKKNYSFLWNKRIIIINHYKIGSLSNIVLLLLMHRMFVIHKDHEQTNKKQKSSP